MLTAIAVCTLAATLLAAALLSRYCARLLSEARTARQRFEANVEGLAVRTHRAARSDRERAQRSTDVAEAAAQLSERIIKAQEALQQEQRRHRASIPRAINPPPLPNTAVVRRPKLIDQTSDGF